MTTLYATNPYLRCRPFLEQTLTELLETTMALELQPVAHDAVRKVVAERLAQLDAVGLFAPPHLADPFPVAPTD